MEKLAQFGVEPILIVAQIVNFFLLLYLLKRFLYKPILSILQKREEKIKEGLEAAVRGEELLVKAKDEEKNILVAASEEAGSVLAKTRERAATIEQEILTKAKKESDEMLSHARVQIKAERKHAEREVERKVVDSAVEVLTNILPKVLTKEDHVRILASSEKMLRKVVSP